MAIKTKDRFFSLAVMVGTEMRRQLEQERKHLNNARCKPADWGIIASIINDTSVGGDFDDPVTAEDVYKWAHEMGWGD